MIKQNKYIIIGQDRKTKGKEPIEMQNKQNQKKKKERREKKKKIASWMFHFAFCSVWSVTYGWFVGRSMFWFALAGLS